MAAPKVKGNGTKENPWQLKTPPGTSEFTMHKDVKDRTTGWNLAALMSKNLPKKEP